MTMTLDRPATSSTIRRYVVQPDVRAAVDDLYSGDTVTAFRAIDTATADPSENVRTWELTAGERAVYEAGFMVGFQMAAPELLAEIASLRARLEQAEHDADRYYAEMCRRPAPSEPSASRQSYAELSRLRGDHDRATRQEAAINCMFTQYASV